MVTDWNYATRDGGGTSKAETDSRTRADEGDFIGRSINVIEFCCIRSPSPRQGPAWPSLSMGVSGRWQDFCGVKGLDTDFHGRWGSGFVLFELGGVEGSCVCTVVCRLLFPIGRNSILFAEALLLKTVVSVR